MQLGKSLLGGIIGAAVGIGLLFAVYGLFGLDKYWLAIPLRSSPAWACGCW